jgi:cobalamin biosynthesis protein CobT
MIRRLFGLAAILLAIPALVTAQARVRGKATRVQGEVVRAEAARTAAGDVAHNQTDGDKVEDQKDAQEGPDVDEGPNEHQGSDVDEGPDVENGQGDVSEGAKDAAQAQHEGDHDDGADAPAPSARKVRIGRHKP